MEDNKALNYTKQVLANVPNDWVRLTTHRLDIYEERAAKTDFLTRFEGLYSEGNASAEALAALPTAYDYIRLGHPLSCVLEWVVANDLNVAAENVISFSSQTVPVFAVLRKNLLAGKKTRIVHNGLPDVFDTEVLKQVYGYSFELVEGASDESLPTFDGSTIYFSQQDNVCDFKLNDGVDFYINVNQLYGSVLVVNGEKNNEYVSEIQHVRRRETIAMTPANCVAVLDQLTGGPGKTTEGSRESDKKSVLASINEITKANTTALVCSSGLSTQYALMMGLVHHALDAHPGKNIRFVVPTNCYGGTNDQARRVAACAENIEVVDLSVDGGQDMVQSIDMVLEQIANEDAVPYIIAEIPTNPRVEVPDLIKLKEVLSQERNTANGSVAIDPVFVLDQTFCPNTPFLGEAEILSSVRTIAYVSGSKFPSGGLCTAGYCVANKRAEGLMAKIDLHLRLCDNEATDLQMELLAKQLPSMNERIQDAYVNTRVFVNFIEEALPTAKINFVSDELAAQGFTPSVFSLDLPTKGATHEEQETYKRALNLKLINMMIQEIPNESKFCVSYGQLKGCYWTIPATSTQGTTKEGDKDYIVRVALSANMDMDHHQKVFTDFVASI